MSSIAKVVGAPRAPTVWERLSARYGTPIYVPGGPLAQSLPTERQGCNPSFTSQVARDRLEARVRKFSARVDELSVQVNEETRARHLEAFRCVPLQQRPEPLPARKRWEPSIGLSQSIRDAEQRIKDSREKCRQTDIRVNERIARWNQRKLERGSQVPLQQQPEPLPARQDGCRTSISERRELTARRINASRQQVASQHHPALSVKSSAVEGFMPPRMRKTVGNQEVKEVKEPSLARQDRCRTSISERRELTARRINASHQQVASQHQPARPVKSSAVEGLTPPRMRTTVGSQEVRPLGRGVSTPMVPRTQRFHSVNTKPVAFSLLPKPKDAQPVGILKKSRAQSKHRPVKKVTFGGNQTREVSRWIGELQVRFFFTLHHRRTILTLLTNRTHREWRQQAN